MRTLSVGFRGTLRFPDVLQSNIVISEKSKSQNKIQLFFLIIAVENFADNIRHFICNNHRMSTRFTIWLNNSMLYKDTRKVFVKRGKKELALVGFFL